MAVHITEHRRGFSLGLTEITRIGEAEDDTGIALSVLKLAGGGPRYQEVTPGETAYLLMEGEAVVEVAGAKHTVRRGSLFDDLPWCVHVPRGTPVTIEPRGPVEFTIHRTANGRELPARVLSPSDVRNERRGKGVLKDAAFRFVRTIFDGTNTDPNAELVLGEVVNLPGRWSSYPPHHHPQPEIYHYRFTRPEGFGHAELGETVLKIRPNDTVKIFDGKDHPQCAAPGYGMYYAWVIRHLPGSRYDVPEFASEHAWISAPGAEHWWPRGIEDDE